MWFGVVTLFPSMFKALSDFGVTGRAIEQNLLSLDLQNPRDFATDLHKTVDDRPYGGGPGMVMKVQPMQDSIKSLRARSKPGNTKVIALSPQGKRVSQQDIADLVATTDNVIFVAGRYEGIDERLYELEVDLQWSIGDYVISGGELAAMVLIDAAARLLPGTLGHAESAQQDSFVNGLLDCPHYTRPEEYAGLRVPEVLMSGNHANIAKWRHEQSEERTRVLRPDLLETEHKN